MYGGKTFSRIILVPDDWRERLSFELFMHEYIERNGSAQNGSKTSCELEAYPYLRGTVPYRTVPKCPCKRSLGGPVLVRLAVLFGTVLSVPV